MSDIHFNPTNLCFYDLGDNNNMMTPSTPDYSHVPFQPWLSSLHTSTMDQSPPITFWSTDANYGSGYNHQQLTDDHYLPPFNQNVLTSVMPGIDNRMTFEQNRPSSVLSSTSSASTSSTITTASSTALGVESGTESTEAVKSKPVSHQSKRKPRSEYRRYPKPPYSYCALIITTIQNARNQRLTLSGILSKLMEMFEFFRGSYTGWRDCVRHNLSHNSCFYKVPYPLPGEDEITGIKSKGRSYWMVDLSKVPSHVFKILDKKAEKSGKYKTYIHEELGLPEIVLPLKYATGEASSSMSDTQTQFTIVDDKFIQQSATRPGYRMRLPDVSSCPVAKDSPEQFRRRDTIEAVTPLTNMDSNIPLTIKRRKLNETCDNARTENMGEIEQQLLWDYVKSITTSVTSSTDAVNNLSGLC